MRLEILGTPYGFKIINDSYNANPDSMKRAVDELVRLKGNGKSIAVLGDMLELGQYSVREHERVGALAAETVDVLITLGLRSQKIAETALAHGLSEKHIYQYDNAERLASEVTGLIEDGDVILVKGSQSVRAERVVKALMTNPDKAPELLVRQDEVWLQKA